MVTQNTDSYSTLSKQSVTQNKDCYYAIGHRQSDVSHRVSKDCYMTSLSHSSAEYNYTKSNNYIVQKTKISFEDTIITDR